MNNHYNEYKGLHLNYEIITNIIKKNAKVLDIGCGEGTLLKILYDQKHCSGVGIEIDQHNAIKSIEKGLSIIQGDLLEWLQNFADNEYDYVILNQTLQSTDKPDMVIDEMIRVGKKAVVSFPNFGYWRVRFYLLFNGTMPKSNILPFEWYNTPNIHLLTVKDFFEFCQKRNIKILDSIYLKRAKAFKNFFTKTMTNLFTEEAVFVISK